MEKYLTDGSIKMEGLYKYDKEFTKCYVLTGACMLARNGMVYASVTHLDLQTDIKEMDLFYAGISSFFYNPDIDYEYCVSKSVSNPLLLLPSKERAVVECIKHLDWIDEGLLIEGIQNYISNFWDKKLLYEAAAHFNLPEDELEYWLEEARNEYDD